MVNTYNLLEEHDRFRVGVLYPTDDRVPVQRNTKFEDKKENESADHLVNRGCLIRVLQQSQDRIQFDSNRQKNEKNYNRIETEKQDSAGIS